MEIPPFEDVSPILKMVVFHCYVGLPKRNIFEMGWFNHQPARFFVALLLFLKQIGSGASKDLQTNRDSPKYMTHVPCSPHNKG